MSLRPTGILVLILNGMGRMENTRAGGPPSLPCLVEAAVVSRLRLGATAPGLQPNTIR